MIEKLEIMIKSVRAVHEHGGRNHTMEYAPHDHIGAYEAEPAVSIIDLANKVNEIIDYLNVKESNATE